MRALRFRVGDAVFVAHHLAEAIEQDLRHRIAVGFQARGKRHGRFLFSRLCGRIGL
jgi:hypothetical protein